MSVSGIDKFKDALRGFEDSCVLIGGSACELLMTEYDADFRATKDLDIVILSDRPVDGFAKAFWAFVEEGGYEPWARSDDNRRRHQRPRCRASDSTQDACAYRSERSPGCRSAC